MPALHTLSECARVRGVVVVEEQLSEFEARRVTLGSTCRVTSLADWLQTFRSCDMNSPNAEYHQ